LILCHRAAAAEIHFAPPITAAQAARWEEMLRTAWAGWETRLGVAVTMPALTIGVSEVAEMPHDLGRTNAGRIELNRFLPADDADRVLLHEAAHEFLQAGCPTLPATSPLLAEAFALFISGDAAGRALAGTQFVYASGARDWLLAHPAARGSERAAQEALSRLFAQAEMQEDWEAFFARLVRSCGNQTWAVADAREEFSALATGRPSRIPAQLDFLLVDGLSQETLASEGRPDARFPTGSILKPSLLAMVPGLMEPRPARATATWHCPEAPSPGEMWTWQQALVRSCNGFFLDFHPAASDAFTPWEEELRRLGFHGLPTTMEGRLGLRTDFTLSPLEVVRLYTWLCRRSPFVVDALARTASGGTLAGLPDAPWFLSRGISLKSGTVRSVRGEPLHAWIVAVGPREADGSPSFVAALHGSGRATSSLLPEIRHRLEQSLTGLERSARVQILGLIRPGSVGLACETATPMLVRAVDGAWRVEPPGSVVLPDRLAEGSSYACPAGALVLRFPDALGREVRRRYYGSLRFDPPPQTEVASSVPLRAKSTRARLGSPLGLSTSEASYVLSSLLSELPNGHHETLKALALVLRNNLHVGRHGDRPLCDTTHCQLFGHDEDVPGWQRRRARQAVAETADVAIAPGPTGPTWLPFFLGGNFAWRQVRPAAAVEEELGLEQPPSEVTRQLDGTVEVVAGTVKRFPCELLRNQLRLPSCPDLVAATAGGFEFFGRGEGHGAGLDLTAAEEAVAQGLDFRALLRRFYPEAALTTPRPPNP
jgi:hypothetical protein